MLAMMSLPSLDTLTDPGNTQGRHYFNICPHISLSLPKRIFNERSIKYVCLTLSFLGRDRGVGDSVMVSPSLCDVDSDYKTTETQIFKLILSDWIWPLSPLSRVTKYLTFLSQPGPYNVIHWDLSWNKSHPVVLFVIVESQTKIYKIFSYHYSNGYK